MIHDQSKTNRQLLGLDYYLKSNGRGTFNYVMRFGKTRQAEMIIERVRDKHPQVRIVAIVPRVIAFENIKHFNSDYNVELYTVQTLYNLIDEDKFDMSDIYLIIVDEIHNMANEKFAAYMGKLNYKFTCGLTGSKLDTKSSKLLASIGFPVIDIITEEEAVANGWISKFIEYNLSVQISDGEKKRFKLVTDKINSYSSRFDGIYRRLNTLFKRDIFKGDFDLLQSCYSGKHIYDKFGNFETTIPPDKLRLLVATMQGWKEGMTATNDYTGSIIENWNPESIREFAKEYQKLITVRRNYINYNISKVNLVLELVGKIDKPTIIYNESIEMIDHLYNSIKQSCVRYHSDLKSEIEKDEFGMSVLYKSGTKKGEPKVMGKKRMRDAAIQSISTGESNILITGKSLNESLNLPNIEYIICTSGDSNAITYDQRVARGKTIDISNENKECKIINFYIDDYDYEGTIVKSRDKQKLQLRQENVKDVIYVDNLNDIFL